MPRDNVEPVVSFDAANQPEHVCPKLVRAVRNHILDLMTDFPHVVALNIQVLYADEQRALRWHSNCGATPHFANVPKVLTRLFHEAIDAQGEQLTLDLVLEQVDFMVCDSHSRRDN